MRMLNLFMLFAIISCSAMPVKDYKVTKWLPIYGNCYERMLSDGSVEHICIDETSDMIGITLGDYIKELDYQSLLIRKCRKWKK